jgi:hypothetical protein
MKVQVYADFYEILDTDININCDKKIELVYEDEFIHFQKPIPEDTIRFFATIEPDGRFVDFINRNLGCFDYLLTAEPALLHLDKAVFMPGYPAWVPADDSIDKKFGVSAIFSSRNVFPGHPLRYELWHRRNEITIPHFFYVSSRHKMPDVDLSKELTLSPVHYSKQAAMDCMFHIAIDCFEKNNLFTEKLIDPLISMVMPIYWGAGNAEEFFNFNSIFRVHSVSEIINICNGLTPDIYWNHLSNIVQNYKIALNYADYPECVRRAINRALQI